MISGEHAVLGSAAVLGIATAIWARFRGLLSRLWSVVFVTVTVQGEITRGLQSLCWTRMRRSPFGSRRYDSTYEHIRPLGRFQIIGFERFGTDPVLFWRGWRPLLVGVPACSGAATPDHGTPMDGRLTLTFIRGTFDTDRLLVESLDDLNDRIGVGKPAQSRRFMIRRFTGMGGAMAALRRSEDRNDGLTGSQGRTPSPISAETGELRLLKWTRAQVGPELSATEVAMDALALPPHVCRVVDELRRWKESEAWFRDKGLPWTRGWLLYGKPGTGKTSLVRAVAQDLDMPVYVFDLASMSNREMVQSWQEMQGNTPCIALIEDIDAVFDGRHNRLGDSGGGLTFDCLLNCLSGIESANGVFKVVTTNNVGSLDEALGVPREDGRGGKSLISTRPGRLDNAMELPPLDAAGRRRIAARICRDCLQHVDRLIREGDGDTGAQFLERCSRVALDAFWAGPIHLNVPEPGPDTLLAAVSS